MSHSVSTTVDGDSFARTACNTGFSEQALALHVDLLSDSVKRALAAEIASRCGGGLPMTALVSVVHTPPPWAAGRPFVRSDWHCCCW